MTPKIVETDINGLAFRLTNYFLVDLRGSTRYQRGLNAHFRGFELATSSRTCANYTRDIN